MGVFPVRRASSCPVLSLGYCCCTQHTPVPLIIRSRTSHVPRQRRDYIRTISHTKRYLVYIHDSNFLTSFKNRTVFSTSSTCSSVGLALMSCGITPATAAPCFYTLLLHPPAALWRSWLRSSSILRVCTLGLCWLSWLCACVSAVCRSSSRRSRREGGDAIHYYGGRNKTRTKK